MADLDTYGDATAGTYAEAGFGAEVHRGARPAVVVVDLTRGFTEAGFPSGSDLTPVVLSTARLVETAHAASVPVVYTAIAYSEEEIAGDCYRWLDKAPGMRAMREGSVAAELDPRLTRGDRDPLIVKKGASAFSGTPLATMLTGLNRDTVLVCGATTSGCVRATAVDAVQAGFSTLVPRECVGDRADGPHRAALFDLDAKYADVVGIDDAQSYLSQTRA